MLEYPAAARARRAGWASPAGKFSLNFVAAAVAAFLFCRLEGSGQQLLRSLLLSLRVMVLSYASIGIQISTPPIPVFGSNSGP